MNQVAAALLIWLCVLGWPTAASAAWTRFNSEHFVFVGDASERDMRDIAQRLEQFRQVVSRVFSDDATISPVPTAVMVFQGDRSFAPFRPVFQGKSVDVVGYFTSSQDANYIAVNAGRQKQAYQVILHEYTHFLLRNGVGDVPVWVNEGLAEFYQTFESSNGGKTVMLGIPNEGNLQLLASTPTLMPLAELTAVESDTPQYNEGDRRGLLYAQSWALVHYLTFGKEREGQLRTYLSAIGQGVEEQEAFRLAFGDQTVLLERELQRYVRSVGLSALRLNFDEPIADSRMSPGETIPDSEASGYLGDMLARLNRTDDARAFLSKALSAKPDAARPMAALGLLELRATNTDAAYVLLERAATLAPGVASIQAAYGRALTLQADRGVSDEDALYARARTVLTRALELDPDNISIIVTLAEVEMGSGADPSRAVTFLQRAVKAAPGREEYKLMLGQALAVSGDYRGAVGYLSALAARGSRPEIREAATRALERVADAEKEARALVALGAAAADSPISTLPPAEPPRPTAQQGVFVPSLRPVQAGESRVLGFFAAVDCRPGAIVLQVDTAAGPVRMAIRDFTDVEFLSYRQDAPGTVACGRQRPAFRVLATFRADQVPGASTPNRAIAIELLPDGFTPP